MKKGLYTKFGECAADEGVVKAVSEWIAVSDLCVKASGEDFPRYGRDSYEAREKLRRYFTNNAITSFIINKDELRQILCANIKDFGTN
jgi:hypothetical protein